MSLDRFTSWIVGEALPLWVEKGFDSKSRLFRERLHLDGSPDTSAVLRIRTAARQIYVYAEATQRNVAPPGALQRAVACMDRLREVAHAPDGKPGWVHQISPTGDNVVDSRRDLYDHAFILQALAWLAKATGEQRYRSWIDECVAFLDQHLAAPAGGWAESESGELPRRQNPHMHLFEAFMALYETSREPRYLARAGELFGLFRTRFYDDSLGVLREFFGERWEMGEAFGSERLEPGHMAEWVWLLRRYERIHPRPVDTLCARLLDRAETLGRGSGSVFLMDETSLSGEPRLDRMRLWCQTEYIKALLVQSAVSPDAGARAESVMDALLASYLSDTPKGTWRDQFTLKGQASHDHIPASTLYHLWALYVEIQAHERMPATAG